MKRTFRKVVSGVVFVCLILLFSLPALAAELHDDYPSVVVSDVLAVDAEHSAPLLLTSLEADSATAMQSETAAEQEAPFWQRALGFVIGFALGYGLVAGF